MNGRQRLLTWLLLTWPVTISHGIEKADALVTQETTLVRVYKFPKKSRHLIIRELVRSCWGRLCSTFC